MEDPLPDSAAPDSPAPATPIDRELPTRWILWGLLLAIATASLIYLVAAPSPWTDGLDTTREVKESIRTRSWVIIGLWYGAAVNLVLAIIALLLWNFRPTVVDQAVDLGDSPIGGGKPAKLASWGRGILVLAATLTAAWAMFPRLSLSLWGDEEATTRRFLIGHVYRMDDDTFQAKRPTWSKAIWNYDNGPNNHMLFNVLARLSHGPADESGDDPDDFYFSEQKIRLPSFLATLLLIPAAAWLTSLLGFPRGGPVVAFLLALHPWVVRYGSDARGYALQMMLGIVAFACLINALRHRHRARWWIAFGIAEFLLLFAHLSGIYLLIPLNLAALWLVWSPFKTGQANPFRVANVWRWGGANLLGAMLTIQMMTPNLLQLPKWVEGGRIAGKVDRQLIDNFFCDWALGTPWHPWDPGNPYAITWRDLHEAHPLLTIWAAALVGLFFLAGLVILGTRKRLRWWLLPLCLPAVLVFADAIRSGNLLYPWYTVGFLPLAFVVVGVGFGAVVPGIDGKKGGFWGAAIFLIAGAAVVVPFAFATSAQREIYRQRPVEPLAESVHLTREVVNPFSPGIDESLTLGFVHASRLYDPAMTLAQSDEEFIDALRRAELLNRPLWVNAANLGLAEPLFPKTMQLLSDHDVFEEPVVLHGLQHPCTRYVFRYRPGGLGRFEAREQGL
ncbi:MAG: hypothetical protein KDN19_08370 [Verrucomicrobiae bacterium]|nr:hypothetical protein [Verrucomicrobiae bacterium]